MASRFVVGLDLGTASVKAVVAERTSRGVLIHGVIKEVSGGIRKGVIQDLSETVPATARVLEYVRKVLKPAVKNVYVNIGTPQVKAQHSRGIVAVSRVDNEIYQDDIDRVVKASQAVNLAPNRAVIHTVTREFIVDGVPDIENPLGLSGNRLEVSSMVIDAFAPHVKNIMKVVEVGGGEIGGLIFDPLSISRAALSKRQKDLGVVLVDIGSGTTSMIVYEEGKLLGVHSFPIGGGNITNDIAVGLKIPVDAAEKIKLNYGYALAREVGAKESIEISEFAPGGRGTVSRRFLSEIIEARLAEILGFVNNELTLLGKAGQLAGGVVLTGGGAKMPGLTELAKNELRLSSQVGFANTSDWAKEGSAEFTNAVEDPEFVNALGLVISCGDKEGWWGEEKRRIPINIKSIFNIFNP